jgi:hypothetical protein
VSASTGDSGCGTSRSVVRPPRLSAAEASLLELRLPRGEPLGPVPAVIVPRGEVLERTGEPDGVIGLDPPCNQRAGGRVVVEGGPLPALLPERVVIAHQAAVGLVLLELPQSGSPPGGDLKELNPALNLKHPEVFIFHTSFLSMLLFPLFQPLSSIQDSSPKCSSVEGLEVSVSLSFSHHCFLRNPTKILPFASSLDP